MEASQLDDLIRRELEKLGISNESEVQAVVEKAEADFEYRVKVQEVRKEVRRLMKLKEEGAKLMRVGGKWKQVFYPK